MNALVVDASVVVKWFLVEELTAAALNVRGCGASLSAPDLVYAEVGSAVWKRWRRSEIDAAVAGDIIEALQVAPLNVFPVRGLSAEAWRLASRHNRSYYDCVYLALAETLDCRMVTADLKFHAALKATQESKRMVWVGDL